MNISDLAHKHILIAGYGIEGKATARFLKKFVPSVQYDITDQTDGPDYLSRQSDYDLVIKTPGIPARDIKIPYTTATNIFFANLPSIHMTVGVTGSKGKSTTASLIHHMLKTAGKRTELVGNIGKPLLDAFPADSIEATLFVCELSSYQLADIDYSPHISIIVSLFPEHIPYHGSVEEYYEAKRRIIAKATSHDYYIYNPRYPALAEWAKDVRVQSVPYENDYLPHDIPLLGEHNRDNVRAAITVARILEISDEEAAHTIATFQPLPHRLEKVGICKGITFYDDAISTTPESTIAAIDALENIGCIFLGGEDRGYDFHVFANRIVERNIPHVVLFPDTGARIKEALTDAGYSGELFETDHMEAAVSYAFTHCPEGRICLLSTASPSYSLWKNFEEKGDEFQKFITLYAQAHEKTAS